MKTSVAYVRVNYYMNCTSLRETSRDKKSDESHLVVIPMNMKYKWERYVKSFIYTIEVIGLNAQVWR